MVKSVVQLSIWWMGIKKKEELETFYKKMREKVNCVIEFAGGHFVIHVDQADVENGTSPFYNNYFHNNMFFITG